jgi:hypothetical protein
LGAITSAAGCGSAWSGRTCGRARRLRLPVVFVQLSRAPFPRRSTEGNPHVRRHAQAIVAIHRNDPQWIIALWLAIHGGDPAPEHISERQVGDIAVNAIRSLAGYLPPTKAKAVTAALGH